MRWCAPCDPDCPGYKSEVLEPLEVMDNDPMTHAMHAPVGEFADAWENKHRAKCKRCQEYGASNIDIF